MQSIIKSCPLTALPFRSVHVWFVSVCVCACMCVCVCMYSLPAIFNFPISVTLIELSPLGWAQSRQTATSATTALAKISSQLRLCFRPLFPPVSTTAGLGDFGSAGCDCSRACVCASQWLMSVANALNSVKCITILPCLDYSCNWAPLLMLAPSISLYPSLSLSLSKHRNSFTPIAALCLRLRLIDGRFVCCFPFLLSL